MPPVVFQAWIAKARRALALMALLTLLLSGAACMPFAHAAGLAQLDTDEMLKPLVDTSNSSRDTSTNALQGGVERQGQSGAASQQGSTRQGATRQPLILTGKVQTLQQAIESEHDTVDWYNWYIAAREYLGRTGGLQCALGTSIKFYRNGQIEAMTFDPVCRASVAYRQFPLPKKTKLDALILPVRNSSAPPASPQEIYSRIEALKRK